MTLGRRLWLSATLATVVVLWPNHLRAQVPAGSGDRPERGEDEEIPSLEAEFIASTIFQEGSLIARLHSALTADVHYFGVEENDVGVVGLSWRFRWHGLNLSPGFGWSFGRENRPAPAASVRWSYEQPRWVTEGLWIQSLRPQLPEENADEETTGDGEGRYTSVLDGIHVSARLGRVELGPMVERIQYRDEREWKGGVRGAWLASRGLRLVGQVLGPGTEVRGGLAWEW